MEVIAVEVVSILVLLPVIVDEVLKSVLLHLQGVNILVSDAVGFSLDAITERQVFDVGQLGFNLHCGIIHFFLHRILLSHQVLFSLESHANLGHLEHNFEKDDEWEHVFNSLRITDSFEKSSLAVLSLVHINSNLLDPGFLKSRSVSFLDSLRESFWGLENSGALDAVGSLRVGSSECADNVEDISANFDSWAGASSEDFLEILECVGVNSLCEPSLMLVHGDEHLVQVTESLVALANLFLLLIDTSLD